MWISPLRRTESRSARKYRPPSARHAGVVVANDLVVREMFVDSRARPDFGNELFEAQPVDAACSLAMSNSGQPLVDRAINRISDCLARTVSEFANLVLSLGPLDQDTHAALRV